MCKVHTELYFLVKKSDTIDTVSSRILDLIMKAQKKHPNQDRYLFIHIKGHRNKNGGFDRDMMIFQTHFLLGLVAEYVKGIKTPSYRFLNPKEQNNSFPKQPVVNRQAA